MAQTWRVVFVIFPIIKKWQQPKHVHKRKDEKKKLVILQIVSKKYVVVYGLFAKATSLLVGIIIC